MNYAVGLAAAVAVAAGMGATGCGKAVSQERVLTPVRTKVLTPEMAADELRYSANVRAETTVNAAFRVGGYVETIGQVNGRDLQEGDLVAKGALLCSLRRQDFEMKVGQAKSQAAEAAASVEAVKAQLAQAEAGLHQAELEFARAKNLFATQSLTRTDYDAAQARRDSLAAQVEAIRHQIAAVLAKTAGAKEVVAEAELAQSDADLRAPISGVVTRKAVERGTLVGPGTAAFSLADTSTVKVVFGVPDNVVAKLRRGLRLPVSTEALPNQTFAGHVTLISPSADIKSRVFDVELSVANLNQALKPGMIATVLLNESAAREVVTVPLSAVVRSVSRPEGYAVFVVTEESGKAVAKARDVTLGRAVGNTIAVSSGLQGGERVVITGSTLLRDGEAVQLIP